MTRFLFSALFSASVLIAVTFASAIPSQELLTEDAAPSLSISELKDREASINPTFRLFLNESNPTVFDYKTSPSQLRDFDPNKGVAMIIHGWRDQYEPNGWMDKMKNFLLMKSDYQLNVIAVDWSRGSHNLYKISSRDTRVVGYTLAGVLESFYRAFDIDLRRIQLIGHSLGAQISGFTGKNMLKSGLKVGRITGLDPAGPNFRTSDINERLALEDAELVEVLHTNMASFVASGFGTKIPSGDVDFYLNGGYTQTGCIGEVMIPFSMKVTDGATEVPKEVLDFEQQATDIETESDSNLASKAIDAVACSHSRAHQYFMTDFDREGNCQPVAYECESFKDFQEGRCADCGSGNRHCKLVGFFPEVTNQNYTKNPSGYYMYTSGKKPYCLHTYQLKVHLNPNMKATKGELKIDLQSEYMTLLKTIPIEGKFEPSTVITKLFSSEQTMGKIIRALAEFKTSSKLLGSYPADVLIDSIDVVYMSNLSNENRLLYSSDICDFETVAANAQTKVIALC